MTQRFPGATSNGMLYRLLTFGLGLAGILFFVLILFFHSKPINSMAACWVDVASNEQPKFVSYIRGYAKKVGYNFYFNIIPNSLWTTFGINMFTPEGNEISVINGTSRVRFSAVITIYHRNQKWTDEWVKFKSYVSRQYNVVDYKEWHYIPNQEMRR